MTSWRHYFILSLCGLAVVGLAVRIVFLGVTEQAFLQQQGDARSVREQIIPAMRGVVTDRQGQPLAVSTPVYSVWTDPSVAEFSAEQIDTIATHLALDEEALRDKLAKAGHKSFVFLKRRVTFDAAHSLREQRIAHIYLQPEYRRYYPAAEIAAHVVGLTDMDDVGIEGIEYAFDERLRGQHGGKIVLKDLRGNIVRDLDYLGAPVFGQDLQLTIDMSLQFLAYRELKSAVASHRAKGGSLVMVDATNGDILALVNQPSYNPNDIGAQLSGMRNRAVTDTFEPGSTIKPFTVLAALESGKYDTHTPIDTSPGYFSISGKLVQDPINYKVVSLRRAIQKSSQVAIAKIALNLRNDAVFDVLQRAGLGELVGTGLPGEATGFISADQLRYPIVRAAFAYGYGLSVTPLQLARAYVTLANGGVRQELNIVSGTQASHRRKRVYDADLSTQVVAMMESVVEAEGTAAKAAVAGYNVAGKTGTARVVGRDGYDDERHAAWFAGIAPAQNPRFVMVVLINEPTAGVSGGGAVAAPVFARVAQRALPLLGVMPDEQYAKRRSNAGGHG